jgi:hypothetical protein
MNTLIAKLALGAIVAGTVALASASPSLAFAGDRYYYEHSSNGSVWSYYPGYFDGQSAQVPQAYAPRAYDQALPSRATRQHRTRQYQGE